MKRRVGLIGVRCRRHHLRDEELRSCFAAFQTALDGNGILILNRGDERVYCSTLLKPLSFTEFSIPLALKLLSGPEADPGLRIALHAGEMVTGFTDETASFSAIGQPKEETCGLFDRFRSMRLIVTNAALEL